MSESNEKPHVAQKSPYALEVEPGNYFWCSCGQSSKQPFCDGAHKGTSFTPVKIEVSEKKTLYWCGCKASANQPFCDGAHNKL